ncbi:MAG: sulfite exporter TauE/SafE family protein, partial [Kiritimatiellia bacterium]|nr:sulfite exporter TauE/SafE family protein [Kiritimatiellia bacterium]
FAAFSTGLAKSGLPGAGILAVPLAAAVFPARASTGLMLPMLIVGDLFALIRFRRHADFSRLVRLLPAAVAGVVVGYFLMGWLTDSQVRPLIGGVILALLMLSVIRPPASAASPDSPQPVRRWLPMGTGLLAGVTTMIANAAGPIMSLYLLAMRLPKEVFIGTAAWYFFLINCLKVPFSAHLGLITADSLRMNLWLIPAVWVGSMAGIRLLHVVPQKAFERIVKILTAAAAVRLLIPS